MTRGEQAILRAAVSLLEGVLSGDFGGGDYEVDSTTSAVGQVIQPPSREPTRADLARLQQTRQGVPPGTEDDLEEDEAPEEELEPETTAQSSAGPVPAFMEE